MREDLRRNLLAQKVVEKEVGRQGRRVTDAGHHRVLRSQQGAFNRTEDAVHIAQIVITPVREQQRTNRTGDDASTPQEATAKAQMLMAAAEGRRDVRRSRGGLLGGSANRRSVAATSASCRCRRCRRRRRPLRDAVLKSNAGHRAAGQPGRRAHASS